MAHLWVLWVSSEATDLHFACLELTSFKLQKGFALQLEISVPRALFLRSLGAPLIHLYHLWFSFDTSGLDVAHPDATNFNLQKRFVLQLEIRSPEATFSNNLAAELRRYVRTTWSRVHESISMTPSGSVPTWSPQRRRTPLASF